MLRANRRRRRLLLAVLSALLMLPGAFFGWRWSVSNFDTITDGRLYRSSQMTPSVLDRTIRDYRIKTVLNLRGVNPSESWYRSERAAAVGAGATQVDLSMSSCQWMSRAQLKTLVKVLDGAEYPMIIHCQWGAERTGLVSAFAELLRPGSTIEDAWAQFSLFYLYVRLKDGKIMAEHLDQYEHWLNERHTKHSPDRFRTWVDEGFAPRSPSREDWPYDPYPLLVVSRPETKVSEVSRRLGKTLGGDSPPPIALKKDVAGDARPR